MITMVSGSAFASVGASVAAAVVALTSASVGALVSVVVLEPQAARPRTITTTSSMVTIFFISVILLVFKLALRHCRCAMRPL